jgi:hypothetical protein
LVAIWRSKRFDTFLRLQIEKVTAPGVHPRAKAQYGTPQSNSILQKKEAEPAEYGGDNFRTGSALANRFLLRQQ